MVKCPGCGTEVSHSAAMCYACGAKLDNPFNLNCAQKDLFKKANDEMDNENWPKAIEYYSQLTALRPEISHFPICIGMAYAFQDKKTEAWDYYSKAIKAGRENEEPWQVRLEFALGEEDNSYLKMHIDEYIGQFGQSSEQLLKLANSIFLVSNKHNDTVAGLCQRILNLDPGNRKAMKLKDKAEKKPGLLSKLFSDKGQEPSGF